MRHYGRGVTAAGLSAACLLAAALLAGGGCARTNPEWAESLSPCCGQDLIEKGIEPPQDRCADIVVDQRTAFRLMKDLGGSAVAHWEVRLIPGGPACIWRIWPGDASWEPDNVQPDWLGREKSPDNVAAPDSTGAPDEPATPDSMAPQEGPTAASE